MRERLPVATVVRAPRRPGDPMSGSERAILVITALVLTAFMAVSMVLPYLAHL